MKVLVVDDHDLIREGLRLVLRHLDDDVTLIEARNCEDALDAVDEHPDLDFILLDLHLPGRSGFAALQEIRSRHSAIPVVVMSASEETEIVLGAIERGAAGFIPKSSASQVMLGALQLVLSGGVYLPQQVLFDHATPAPGSSLGSADALRPGPAKDRVSPADLGLTDRQVEVLALMAQGKSNKTICRELGLAEGTVKVHVTAILKAFNASNRTQAVITAGKMGLRFEGIHLPVDAEHYSTQ